MWANEPSKWTIEPFYRIYQTKSFQTVHRYIKNAQFMIILFALLKMHKQIHITLLPLIKMTYMYIWRNRNITNKYADIERLKIAHINLIVEFFSNIVYWLTCCNISSNIYVSNINQWKISFFFFVLNLYNFGCNTSISANDPCFTKSTVSQ